jgi:hypothetical protein
VKITVPMKARISTRSWISRRAHPAVRKAERRYLFSIALFIITASMLVIGSVTSITADVSAQENNRSRFFQWLYSQRNDDRPTGRNEERSTQPGQATRTQNTDRTNTPEQQEASPASPTTTPPAQTTPTTNEPVANTPAPTPVINVANDPVEVATPAPVEDTAPVIATMTEAQAIPESQPVTYTSMQISDETRNRLFGLAGMSLVSGAMIYYLSKVGVGGLTSSSLAPVRRIPVKQVVSR